MNNPKNETPDRWHGSGAKKNECGQGNFHSQAQYPTSDHKVNDKASIEALEVLRGAGLLVDDILFDGNLHRVPITGNPAGMDGRYIAHADNPQTVWWRNWDSGEEGSWAAKGDTCLTEEECLAFSRRREVDRQAKEADSPILSWAAPRSLISKFEGLAYPADALPPSIRAAVDEVQAFVKCPYPMVANSALSVLSLAGQAHVDAQRDVGLEGPVSLFFLTVADSGERKTSVDKIFLKAIWNYLAKQAEAAKPLLKKFMADHAAWTAQRDGILGAIKANSKAEKEVNTLQGNLATLQMGEPAPPRVPSMIRMDSTPEHLAWSLAKEWPSCGIISAEAGIVFGSHGMGGEAVMRNLGQLNNLWGAEELVIGRRTSESFTVRGVRLTMSLQVQQDVLEKFFEKNLPLARGSGFLARFLLSWPESTMGTRLFTEPPENWPQLAAFRGRISAILDLPAPIDEDGALAPSMLTFTAEAKKAWIFFHDAIEKELRVGGELHDVRDVAAKVADNAARLAALFHFFDHDRKGAIGVDSFESASRVAAWHLTEARRFFGEMALPVEMADAARLDSWLIEHCREMATHYVGKNHVRRYGPLRDGKRLDRAIEELEALDRLQVAQAGKRRIIYLNPALLGVAL